MYKLSNVLTAEEQPYYASAPVPLKMEREEKPPALISVKTEREEKPLALAPMTSGQVTQPTGMLSISTSYLLSVLCIHM